MAKRKSSRKKNPSKKPKAVPSKRATDLSWIEYLTGKTRVWWVAEVQRLISKHSKPTKDPRHGATQTDKAMAELIAIIHKTFPKKGQPFDGNMRMAAVLSYVLALWYSRLHRAKAYDPRRPVKHRQAAYWNRLSWANAMFLALADESEDPEHFPQRYENPFDPWAIDGYFV